MALSGSFLYVCQPIASCITLATLWALGIELTVYKTFLTFSLLSTIRNTVSANIAQPAKYLSDFWAALRRIQALLEMKMVRKLSPRDQLQRSFDINTKKRNERREWRMAKLHQFNSGNGEMEEGNSDDTVQKVLAGEGSSTCADITSVLVKDVTCSWIGGTSKKITLNSVSLSAVRGELVMVTGPVGCGKTSLLFSILQELPLMRGEIMTHGKIAYVPQQPWIFAGTVQDNILFGKPMEKERYQKVIRACDMGRDIRKFPDGDMTTIGERGVLLSGGQRARVGLARAVYANADIYLMDDPLSAVDAKVGKHIFEKCICEALAEKTRIIVTHRLQYLKNADHIIVMDNGTTKEEGSYKELCESGLEFDNLEETHPQPVKGVEKPPVMVQRSESNISREDGCAGFEMDEEERLTGSVSYHSYWKYFRAGRSTLSVVMLLVLFFIAQGMETLIITLIKVKCKAHN